jgi:hypothetical protein
VSKPALEKEASALSGAQPTPTKPLPEGEEKQNTDTTAGEEPKQADQKSQSLDDAAQVHVF